jgi:hypothetical protein
VVSATKLIQERLDDLSLECESFDEHALLHQGEIILCDTKRAQDFFDISSHYNLFILSSNPSLHEGKYFLSRGAKGYGNLYMHKKYLLQALSVIEKGNVWVYPKLKETLT